MATIDLQPTLVDRLEALARSEGVTLEVYLERLASQRSLENTSCPPLSGDELEQLLDAEAANDSTYQGTYSRADIYRDHD
jgi:hypothetical protein